MKKIISLIIIVVVLYIVAIFKAPTLANELEKLMWLDGFNQKIIDLKERLDNFWTKVPTKDELKDYYSWAVDSIEKTKENIDNLRKKADDIQDTYESTKETINQAQEKLEDIKETVDKISEVWESITNTITSTWVVN